MISYYVVPEKLPKKGKKKMVNRHNWCEEEMMELHDIFKDFFKEDKTPSRKEAEAIVKQNKNKGLLWKISTDKIVKKISWIKMQKKRKMFLSKM